MKIERMITPLNKHEEDFIVMVSKFSGLGYGRMKQIITGLWANLLRESSDMSEYSALMGALDFDTWMKTIVEEKEEVTDEIEKLVGNNENNI